MKVVEDFESRPHKAVSFFVRQRKKDTGMECGYSGGSLPGRSEEERGREEDEEEKDSRERDK